MRGRVLSIKKSTWLMISLIFNLVIFLTLSIVSMAVMKDFGNAFFFFCIGTGIHQIIKGALFRLDSSCYLGSLLTAIGLFYFYCEALSLAWLYPVFIILSFAFASFTVANYFNEPFQFFLAFSLFFVSLGLLLFLLKIISVWFFVAIIAVCVLLLIIRFFTL